MLDTWGKCNNEMAQSEYVEDQECNRTEWNSGEELRVEQEESSPKWRPRWSNEKDGGNPQMQRLEINV